ncbi:MAG: thiamine pyrophosphate-dependent enzyme, partial [Longimicrobiales bacterium]
GLTKGQFSASADIGSKPKRGEANRQTPIDPVLLALNLGATFVARSFSGDKEQLVPILKAALLHKGFAFIDIISPCVTFNDHEGSTKSYTYTREHVREVVHTDLVPLRDEITVSYDKGDTTTVRLHDGSTVRLHKVATDYDPTDRDRAFTLIREHQRAAEVATGLLFLGEGAPEMHDNEGTVETPLASIPHAELCPGSLELDALMEMYR